MKTLLRQKTNKERRRVRQQFSLCVGTHCNSGVEVNHCCGANVPTKTCLTDMSPASENVTGVLIPYLTGGEQTQTSVGDTGFANSQQSLGVCRPIERRR